MASHSQCQLIVLSCHESQDEMDDGGAAPPPSPRKRRRCCNLSYRPRRVDSKGAVLVLVWTFLVYGAFTSASQGFASKGSEQYSLYSVFSSPALYCTWLVFYPIAGWLADVYLDGTAL